MLSREQFARAAQTGTIFLYGYYNPPNINPHDRDICPWLYDLAQAKPYDYVVFVAAIRKHISDVEAAYAAHAAQLTNSYIGAIPGDMRRTINSHLYNTDRVRINVDDTFYACRTGNMLRRTFMGHEISNAGLYVRGHGRNAANNYEYVRYMDPIQIGDHAVLGDLMFSAGVCSYMHRGKYVEIGSDAPEFKMYSRIFDTLRAAYNAANSKCCHEAPCPVEPMLKSWLLFFAATNNYDTKAAT